MTIPWTLRPYQFSANAGVESVIVLHVPHRGVLNALRIDDLSDSDGDDDSGSATFDLVTLEAAALEEARGSLSLGMPGEFGVQYSVLGGPQNIVNGVYAAQNLYHAYRNMDGTYSVPVRRLYLVIKPSGVGTRYYSITMTIFMPEIG